MANLGTITRGDSETIELTIYNADESVRNISTDTIRFVMRKRTTDTVPDLEKTTSDGITKTNAAAGRADVAIDPDDLLALAEDRRMVCEVEVTTSGGAVATTLHTVDFIAVGD